MSSKEEETTKADAAPVEAPAEVPVEKPVESEAVPTQDSTTPVPAVATAPEEGGIETAAEMDVLNGRGAYVNAHKGNQEFRAMCFRRKPEFDAGNHAVKRRIATEIVAIMMDEKKGRFLKKKDDKGPWFEQTREKAILKACQVMRDFRRPDRMARRAAASANARKRQRHTESTPGASEVVLPAVPMAPIIENPFGVHSHDVLSGRGAYVNGHVGNARFRTLALERKVAFEEGNYSDKRALATEIVEKIRALDPPGRFLKRKPKPKKTDAITAEGKMEGEEYTAAAVASSLGGGATGEPKLEDEWVELGDDDAIHKACQVMRDIDRPDRTPERRRKRKAEKKDEEETTMTVAEGTAVAEAAETISNIPKRKVKKDSMALLAETSQAHVASAVEEAVAATEEALDKEMGEKKPEETADPVEV